MKLSTEIAIAVMSLSWRGVSLQSSSGGANVGRRREGRVIGYRDTMSVLAGSLRSERCTDALTALWWAAHAR